MDSWYGEMADHLRSVDPNHLITTGKEVRSRCRLSGGGRSQLGHMLFLVSLREPELLLVHGVAASACTRAAAERSSAANILLCSQPSAQGFFAEGDPMVGADPNDGNLWAMRSGQDFRWAAVPCVALRCAVWSTAVCGWKQ